MHCSSRSFGLVLMTALALADRLGQQPGEGMLVAPDEPRDRRVIGTLLRGDEPARHVLDAGALDRPPVTVSAIRAVERVEIDHRDGVDHEPCGVVVRQPVPHVGRHEERLITITSDGPCSDRLKPTGQQALYATASRARGRSQPGSQSGPPRGGDRRHARGFAYGPRLAPRATLSRRAGRPRRRARSCARRRRLRRARGPRPCGGWGGRWAWRRRGRRRWDRPPWPRPRR